MSLAVKLAPVTEVLKLGLVTLVASVEKDKGEVAMSKWAYLGTMDGPLPLICFVPVPTAPLA